MPGITLTHRVRGAPLVVNRRRHLTAHLARGRQPSPRPGDRARERPLISDPRKGQTGKGQPSEGSTPELGLCLLKAATTNARTRSELHEPPSRRREVQAESCRGNEGAARILEPRPYRLALMLRAPWSPHRATDDPVPSLRRSGRVSTSSIIASFAASFRGRYGIHAPNPHGDQVPDHEPNDTMWMSSPSGGASGPSLRR
jgi:hypothetical protein